VLDRPLDSLNRVLDVDEDFTHPFRLTALVGLRQCIRNVATLFYLTVPGSNQLSNVLIFLSHSDHLLRSLASRLRASPGRLPLPSKFCVELVERPSQVGNGSANRCAFQADVFMALLDLPNMVLDVLGHAAEIALYLVYVRRYSIALAH
jgi:hypothetical protein